MFEGPFVFGHLRRQSGKGPAHSSDGSFGSAIPSVSRFNRFAGVEGRDCRKIVVHAHSHGIWQVPQGHFSGNGRTPEGMSYRTIEAGLKANTTRLQAFFLHHRLGPVFQRFFHLVQELVRDGAIHHAMVVAQCHVAHRTDGDGIVDHYRALLNRSQA